MLSSRATNLVDLAAVTCRRLVLYTTLVRSDRAVEVCLEYLRRVGIDWRPHPPEEIGREEYELWRRLGDRPIEALADLPPMTDETSRATMDVLSWSQAPALFTDQTPASPPRLPHGQPEPRARQRRCVVRGLRLARYAPRAVLRRLPGGVPLRQARPRSGGESPGAELQGPGLRVLRAPRHFLWTRHVREGIEMVRLRPRGRGRDRQPHLRVLRARRLDLAPPSSRATRSATCSESRARARVRARAARFGLVVDKITGQLRLIRALRGLTPELPCSDGAELDERRFGGAHLEW